MRNTTHYFFSLAVIFIEGLFISRISVTELIILFPLAFLVSVSGIAPNLLDSFFCLDRNMKTCTERCRHPLTHHPATFLTLVLILSLINIETTYYGLYFLLTKTFLLSYGSHLLLDMMSYEGIPIGTTPTLFCQDQSKNYRFNEITKPRKRLLIPIMKFSRVSRVTNRRMTIFCLIIIGFYSFLVFLELYHDLSKIMFIWDILNELMGGFSSVNY